MPQDILDLERRVHLPKIEPYLAVLSDVHENGGKRDDYTKNYRPKFLAAIGRANEAGVKIAVPGNPLEDISALERMSLVMIGGTIVNGPTTPPARRAAGGPRPALSARG